MIKTLLHFRFLIPALLFLAHQITQKLLHLELPFIDSYLDPFCFIPIALGLLQIERKWLYDQQRIEMADAIVFTVIAALVSEAILPYFFDRFVADPFDLLAYGLGLVWWIGTRK